MTAIDARAPEIRFGNERAVWWITIASIIGGTLIRIILAGISDGTNDALIWHYIATLISEKGLIGAYQSFQGLNHPPLAAIWSVIALHTDTWFTFVMKIPAIVGDALSVALVAKIWSEQKQFARAEWAAVAMALSPVAIIISGYHCNTDNLYAFFGLLAMYLISSKKAFFKGGLALGAAINVKLIPVILVPAAFSFCRNWREALRLLGALTLAAIPFLPLVFTAWDAVKLNMLSYSPPLAPWGIAHILHDINQYEGYAAVTQHMMEIYRWFGRWLILGLVGLLCAINFFRRCWSGPELATIIFSLFLVLATGFGNQYTTILLPMMLVVSIPKSWAYGALAGLYNVLQYGAFLVVDPIHPEHYQRPFLTKFPEVGVAPGGAVGLLAWGVLVWVVIDLLNAAWKRSRPPAAVSDAIVC